MRTRLGSGHAAVGATLAAALLLSGCSAASEPSAAGAPAAQTATPAPPTREATATPPAPAAAEPTPVVGVGVEPARVSLPTLGLDEALIPLGIQADGEMEVPVDYDDVGWFTGGGRPGGVGPTVIAGHVDSRSGPAVFFRLGELRAGDAFSITDVDGAVHDYRVTGVENHPKAQFPTARVFGATLDDEVRLVTCGGEYDTSIGRYVDNVVVFAERA